jgi:hypothetical protein
VRKRGREAWEGDQLMAGRAESSVRWNGQSGGMDNLKRVKGKRKECIGKEVVRNTEEYAIDQGIAEEIEEVKEHRVVNHRVGEWASGEAHGNGCENRNGFLRTFLRRRWGFQRHICKVTSIFEPFDQ